MLSIITPTHDPKFLAETAKSVFAQTHTDWEWVILTNGPATVASVHRALGSMHDDGRIRIEQSNGPNFTPTRSIGALKLEAFSRGRGDVLIELDHDDLLDIDALDQIATAFEDPTIDFAYSNSADVNFDTGESSRYPEWEKNGWRYHEHGASVAFEPSAAALSLIYYAPNHVRAWRRSFYEKIGGHKPGFQICDDHELLINTYLHGRMKHIDKCLYLYRMGNQNTFSGRLDEIKHITYGLHAAYIEKLVLREGELRGLPCFDLGGAFSCPSGWFPVDWNHKTDRTLRFGPVGTEHACGAQGGDVQPLKHDDHPDKVQVWIDLSKRWPFADSSVMAFRAHDIIEHIADKRHFMSELHRCLVPGGWALISVPSTDGRGAFQDPTHVSYWNENSFWYWTRSEQAAYIHNTEEMFMTRRLFTFFPSDWHKEHDIPYAKAELQAFKGDMIGIPGVRP